MENEIIIKTPRGCVRLAVTGQKTFDMKGPREAQAFLVERIPAFQPTDNLIDGSGDALARVLYLADAEFDPAVEQGRRVLTGHEEMKRLTFTENPLVLFQTRAAGLDDVLDHLTGIRENSHDEAAVNSATLAIEALGDFEGWKTERVFLDLAEAEDFVGCQRHRYAEDDSGKTWRFFTGIADGVLKRVAREARDVAAI